FDGAALRICLFMTDTSNFVRGRRRTFAPAVPPSAGMNRIRFEGSRSLSDLSPVHSGRPWDRGEFAPGGGEVNCQTFGETAISVWPVSFPLIGFGNRGDA